MNLSLEPDLGSGIASEPVCASIARAVTHFPARGCLAGWQAKRVRLYIEANLARRLDTKNIAGVVNLSASHFCRCFRRTFGVTVHRYVMQRRIERAQQLMLERAETLSGIACSCGLSDQSHLTRWFRRIVGETPAAWRRRRWEPVATDVFTEGV